MHRDALCGLRIRDIQSRQGVHFRVKGERGIRFIPVQVMVHG